MGIVPPYRERKTTMLTTHPSFDKPTSADAGPSIEERLRPIFERLSSPDDHQRRDAIVRVMAMAEPPVRVLIIDHLVSLLKSRSAAKRDRAEDSLFKMKEWGLPCLRSAILGMRRPRGRGRPWRRQGRTAINVA